MLYSFMSSPTRYSLNFRGSNKIIVPGIRPEAKKSDPKKVKLNDYPMAKVNQIDCRGQTVHRKSLRWNCDHDLIYYYFDEIELIDL